MESFPIAPVSVKFPWFLIPVGLIMLAASAFLLVAAFGPSRAHYELTRDELRLRGDAYGKPMARRDLLGDSARLVNITTDDSLRPRWRTWGTAYPGYLAGWFRLRNGEKALLSVTDRTRVVLIPTRLGHVVMLSPADPERFLAALRRDATAP